MKKVIIILVIFIGVGINWWVFRQFSPLNEQHHNQIPFEPDAKTYFFVGADFNRNVPRHELKHWNEWSGYRDCLWKCFFPQRDIKNDQTDLKNTEQQLATYRECKKQLAGSKPKAETLRVMRTASSFVMNSPASFSIDISNNTITGKGKGADEEDIYVLYLSDGTVLKASPRDKPQWLGTKVGEKVRKVTSYEAVLHGNTYKVDTIVRYSPLYE